MTGRKERTVLALRGRDRKKYNKLVQVPTPKNTGWVELSVATQQSFEAYENPNELVGEGAIYFEVSTGPQLIMYYQSGNGLPVKKLGSGCEAIINELVPSRDATR